MFGDILIPKYVNPDTDRLKGILFIVPHISSSVAWDWLKLTF